MDELFGSLIPMVFSIVWFLIVVSTVVRIFKSVANASKNKGKGFDQDTVRKKLEELRRTLGEIEEQKRQESQAGMPPASQYPGPSRQAPQPVAKRVIRSRFEDYRGEAPGQQAYEGAEGAGMEGTSGSLEGTSQESLREWEMSYDQHMGGLTPFQKELMGGSLKADSTEGVGSEEPSTVKGVDTFESWAKEPIEGFEEGSLEQQLQSMMRKEEPDQVDLVGWIDMKEMADAIVWQEIMSRPLARRRFEGFRARRAY